MAAILENGRFLRFAVNWIKTPSKILMLEVSYTQIHRQNLCLKRCIQDFMAGPGLERMTGDSSRMMADLNVNNSWPSWLQICVLLRQTGERGYSVCDIITLELRRLFIVYISVACYDSDYTPRQINLYRMFFRRLSILNQFSWNFARTRVICRIPWNFHQKIFYSINVDHLACNSILNFNLNSLMGL